MIFLKKPFFLVKKKEEDNTNYLLLKEIYMKDWIKYIISYLLIGFLSAYIIDNLFLKDKDTSNNDIKIKYELQIDSIKNEITKREKIVDSLHVIINKNDSTINDLTNYIGSLKNERTVIKKKYESRDKELKQMSNDSVVMFVREQLMLWTEQE
jgi:septal ring factor EnvC (AmiA/AmiB activator)